MCVSYCVLLIGRLALVVVFRRHRPARIGRWRERGKIVHPDRTVTLTTSAQ